MNKTHSNQFRIESEEHHFLYTVKWEGGKVSPVKLINMNHCGQIL